MRSCSAPAGALARSTGEQREGVCVWACVLAPRGEVAGGEALVGGGLGRQRLARQRAQPLRQPALFARVFEEVLDQHADVPLRHAAALGKLLEEADDADRLVLLRAVHHEFAQLWSVLRAALGRRTRRPATRAHRVSLIFQCGIGWRARTLACASPRQRPAPPWSASSWAPARANRGPARRPWLRRPRFDPKACLLRRVLDKSAACHVSPLTVLRQLAPNTTRAPSLRPSGMQLEKGGWSRHPPAQVVLSTVYFYY